MTALSFNPRNGGYRDVLDQTVPRREAYPLRCASCVFVSGAPEESLAADVDGTIHWKPGRMVLRGRITGGRLDGAAFELTAELQQLDGRGQWRAERVVAAK
jgi:hypothetical protein